MKNKRHRVVFIPLDSIIRKSQPLWVRNRWIGWRRKARCVVVGISWWPAPSESEMSASLTNPESPCGVARSLANFHTQKPVLTIPSTCPKSHHHTLENVEKPTVINSMTNSERRTQSAMTEIEQTNVIGEPAQTSASQHKIRTNLPTNPDQWCIISPPLVHSTNTLHIFVQCMNLQEKTTGTRE